MTLDKIARCPVLNILKRNWRLISFSATTRKWKSFYIKSSSISLFPFYHVLQQKQQQAMPAPARRNVVFPFCVAVVVVAVIAMCRHWDPSVIRFRVCAHTMAHLKAAVLSFPYCYCTHSRRRQMYISVYNMQHAMLNSANSMFFFYNISLILCCAISSIRNVEKILFFL